MQIPESLQSKSLAKFTLNDLVFLILLKAQEKNHWLTFQHIQSKIQEVYSANGFSDGYIRKNKFYDSTSISAAIRALRNINNRCKYNLPEDMNIEIVDKRKKLNSKAIEYKLINIGEYYGK